MRPSKLRLPDSTETTARSSALDDVGDLLRQRARCCRCRSCSRSRRGGSRAPRGTRSGRRGRGTRSRPSSPGASEVLTHGLTVRPVLHGVAGEQAGAEHHRRVGGVRAARDRGDHDVAVVELGLGAVGERDRACACWWRSATCGAAACRRAGSWPSARGSPWVATGSLAGKLSVDASSSSSYPRRRRAARPRAPSGTRRLDSVSEHAVLGALGPGDARHDRRPGRARARR